MQHAIGQQFQQQMQQQVQQHIQQQFQQQVQQHVQQQIDQRIQRQFEQQVQQQMQQQIGLQMQQQIQQMGNKMLGVPSHRPTDTAELRTKRSAEALDEPADSDNGKGSNKKTLGSGTHVKARPDMQQRARAGQEHWLGLVKQVRSEWVAHETCSNDLNYKYQIDVCQTSQTKSQHECLLRTLQIACADGLIRACPFAASVDNTASFLGWTGFQVNPEHSTGDEPRAVLEDTALVSVTDAPTARARIRLLLSLKTSAARPFCDSLVPFEGNVPP